jgi:hypothetical protein
MLMVWFLQPMRRADANAAWSGHSALIKGVGLGAQGDSAVAEGAPCGQKTGILRILENPHNPLIELD